MRERREAQRFPLRQSCVLSVSGRQIQAQIENLSRHGCLASITDPAASAITDEDLGLEATFALSSGSSTREYTGEIIRRYYADGAYWVALRFWKKYRET
jgi:hypothetical protein